MLCCRRVSAPSVPVSPVVCCTEYSEAGHAPVIQALSERSGQPGCSGAGRAVATPRLPALQPRPGFTLLCYGSGGVRVDCSWATPLTTAALSCWTVDSSADSSLAAALFSPPPSSVVTTAAVLQSLERRPTAAAPPSSVATQFSVTMAPRCLPLVAGRSKPNLNCC